MRHGRLRSSHVLREILKRVLVGALVLAVGATSVAAIVVWDTARKIKPGIHLALAANQAPPKVGAIEGGANILLTGTDSRSGLGGGFSSAAELSGSSGAGSNDVTMVLHISKDHTNAAVISIPRDMMLPIPACPDGSGGNHSAQSKGMFNTTLSEGGLSCVVLTAEALTGLNIAYAAEINFNGVVALSNAVGGVSVCIATPINDDYAGLNLAAGQQTIAGSDALAFVRSRHGVGDGSDLGRISNQQTFLSALMRKITSAGVLSNPLTLYAIANAVVTNLQLSDTLTSPDAMVSIAVALKSVNLNNLVFVQYPATSDPNDPNRVIPDATAGALLNAALAAEQPLQLTGAVGRAAVLDTNAPPPAPTTAPSSDASATPTPAPTASAGPAVVAASLPTTVSGQTAAQATCAKGNN